MGFRTQVCKECFLKSGWLPGAIRTVLQLSKSVKDPKQDEKYNEVKTPSSLFQVHLEIVKEMKTLLEAFHPDHMDKTYFLNDDGDDGHTFMSMGLKLKVEDAYNKAVNSEKYIQKLKLELAHFMHIQEEMKKTIKEKKEDLVHAKVCYLVRREKQKQEEAAEETDNEAEAEEAEAEGDKVNKKSNSSDEEDDSSDDDDDDFYI